MVPNYFSQNHSKTWSKLNKNKNFKFNRYQPKSVAYKIQWLNTGNFISEWIYINQKGEHTKSSGWTHGVSSANGYLDIYWHKSVVCSFTNDSDQVAVREIAQRRLELRRAVQPFGDAGGAVFRLARQQRRQELRQLMDPTGRAPSTAVSVTVVAAVAGLWALLRHGGLHHDDGFTVVGAPVLLSAAPDPVQPDTLLQHAHAETFLVPAGLAGFPPALIDGARVHRWACIIDISLEVKTNYIPIETKSKKFFSEKINPSKTYEKNKKKQ